MTTRELPAITTSRPDEFLAVLQARLDAGTDPAAAVAAGLAAELGCRSVAVHGVDPLSGALVLLAAAGLEGHVLGSRAHRPTGALGVALRTGRPHRTTNAYVEPDFVQRLPGETRSELAVPFGSPDVHGVIHLEYAPPHQPGPADEAIAAAAADHLAAGMEAVERTSASSEGRRAALLASLAHLIAQSDDAPRVLQRVVDGARELTRCGAAVLLTRHGARQMLEVAAVAGSVPCNVGDRFPMHEGLAGEVLRSAQPRSLPARGGAGPWGGTALPGVRNGMAAPVAAAGKVHGVLLVLNRHEDEAHFSAAEVDALACVAGYAGSVEGTRQVAALRQRLSDASTIAEVGRAMTGTLGTDEVLALVVRGAEMLANGRGVALGLMSDDRTRLTLASTSGVLTRARGQVVPAEETVMGWAAVMGEIVLSPCVSDDARGYPHEVRQGPAVVVPLESHGKLLGSLMVTRAEGAPLPADEDIDALRKLAGYAAIAIDNARLYREQTELSRALRAQAEELERAYAELNDSQQRLLVSEKMAALGRLTAGIAHEINSPLGGVMNCLQLAMQYAREYQSSIGDPQVTPADHGAIAGDLIESLGMAEGATRKVAQFVRTIKAQTRTGDETTLVPFDPAAELEGVLVLLQHEIVGRGVTLHTHADPELQLVGDPGKFSLVVQNLVSNAIDAYGGEGGEVWIRLLRRGDDLTLEVEDRGSGIPEEIRSRIFDYLFTTKDVGKGTGLGLSTVHSIVTTHFHGTIELHTEVGSGTTFSILIPASPRRS